MNAIDKARGDRSRNLARLRKLTIGTAALGVAATSGFGYLAAMTYTGTTSSPATAYVTAATSSSTTSPSTTLGPAVATAVGRGHVSSGGS